MRILILLFLILLYVSLLTISGEHTRFTTPVIPPGTIALQDNIPTQLPSVYNSTFSIPDILLRDPKYQQAGLIESVPVQQDYTTDPVAALVNIYCTVRTDGSIRTTTGSGFFISPTGVILTNAHVAQVLLLEELPDIGETSCTIRTGNPASDRYQVELLYIPPSWVLENANAIAQDRPVGTGERDYALLYITASLTHESLPPYFSALRLNTNALDQHAISRSVTVSGYPAIVESKLVDFKNMQPRVASTTITNLYTFGSNKADVMSLSGSLVGGYGSSGGPVIQSDGLVTGLIATKGDDRVDGPGSLRAITLSYIDRTIKQETGFNLKKNTQGDLSFRAETFHNTLSPFLRTWLQLELSR